MYSTPLNSKTFGGIMNIVAWLPLMTGYTMSFLLNQRIRSSKAKECLSLPLPTPPPYFTAPDLPLYTYNSYKVSRRDLTVLRVTDQEYVFSLTVSFMYNRQELCAEWENRKVL